MKSKYEIVYFDVDSTLVACEGLDWLAEQKEVGEQVSMLTKQSMEGTIPLEEVFARKVDLLKPSKAELKLLGEYYCSQLVEKSEEVISTLKKIGLEIHLVTGSLTPSVLCLADRLDILLENVHANKVFHDTSGNYRGLDLSCPLTRSNGKVEFVKLLGNGKRSVFIGDSVTDLATKPFVTTFVGYGGVSVRKKVKENSDFFIKSRSLEPLLWLLLD